MVPLVDHYQILGVHRQAEPEVIDAAFRAMARRHHPDRNAGDRSASERMRWINEAHAVLSDPERRRAYNREWDAQHTPPPPVSKRPPAPCPTAPQPKPPPPANPFAASTPPQPAGKERPKQWSSDLGRSVAFLVLALISTSIGVALVFDSRDHPLGRQVDPAFVVLICLAAGLYFGQRAWSIFQDERSLVGLTEENIAQAMSWGKRTVCPPVGQGCFEIPWNMRETRQTCTWRGLCRIGGITLRNSRGTESWEVWIDGRTGLGRLRQRGRQTR
jgi:hypothetical protein